MALILRMPLDQSAAAPTALPAALVRAALGVLARGGERVRPRTQDWAAGVIVIDGRSGSGKTSVAGQLSRALTIGGVRGLQLAHLDSWYQGWSGLGTGTRITEGLLAGRRVGYPTWDWPTGRVSGFVGLDRRRPIIIEGAGSLTRESAAGADLRIWLEVGVPDPAMEAAVRKRRALDRDGDGFRPWWDMWAEQEVRHVRDHDPRALADIVLET